MLIDFTILDPPKDTLGACANITTIIVTVLAVIDSLDKKGYLGPAIKAIWSAIKAIGRGLVLCWGYIRGAAMRIAAYIYIHYNTAAIGRAMGLGWETQETVPSQELGDIEVDHRARMPAGRYEIRPSFFRA